MNGVAPARRTSDLGVRAVAGAAMIAVALAALWAGGVAFWLLAGAAALLMMVEWAGLMRAPRWKTLAALALLGIVLAGGRVLTSAAGFRDVASGFVLPGVYLLLIELSAAAAFALALATLSPRLGMGLLYVALPVTALLCLRGQPHGAALALWTLAVVWATDIGAYFAGRAIGGPKLAPRISPSKTWAGLTGGAAAALAAGYAVASAAALPHLLLVLGAPMAVLAQAGDLFESWLKRRAGVKDSGTLLPGHGGVLDRLDGLVPVAVAVALMAMLGAL